MLTGRYCVGSHAYLLRGYDFEDNVALYVTAADNKSQLFMDAGIKLGEENDPNVDVALPVWTDMYLSIGIGFVQCSKYVQEEDGRKYENRINKELISRIGSIIRGMKANCTAMNKDDKELFDTGFVSNKVVKYNYEHGWIKLEMKSIRELHYNNEDTGEVLELEDDGSFTEKINKITRTQHRIKMDLSEFVTKVDDGWDFDDFNDGKVFSLEEIIKQHPEKSYKWLWGRKYTIIQTIEELEDICKKIWKHDEIVAFDTETTGLYVNVTSRQGIGDRLVGIIFSIKPGEAWYIPIAHKKIKNICDASNEQYIIEKYIKPILEKKDMLCHNGAYDWKVMYNYGIDMNLKQDTMILFKLTLWNDHRGLKLGLKSLTHQFLNRDSFELKDFVSGKFGVDTKFWDLEPESVKYYACPDTDNLIELYQYALDNHLLEKYGAKKIYEIEVAMSKVIAYQEYYGHCVDVTRIPQLVKDIDDTINHEYQEMVKIVGHDFNPRSSTVVSKICVNELHYPVLEYTETGNPSFGKQTRAKLMQEKNPDGTDKYPLMKHLNEYMNSATLKSNFTNNISKFATEDGLMFSEVVQFLETGRLSCKNPNYQGYSDVVKKYIIPRHGYYAIDCDYSSVEARIMVSMAGCKNMVQMLTDPDADYHTLKASQMFNIPYELVTHKQRKMSKGVNFGILYGLGDPNLGVNLYGEKTPENTRKAKKQKERYFIGMEELRGFIEKSREQGINNFYSTTYFGRRRYFDPRKTRKDTIERQSGNARIQGTAADIYKVAMVRLFHQIVKRGWMGKVLISGFVHDEAFIEVSKSLDPAIVFSVIRKCMMLPMKGWCPLFIGGGFGRNWYEAKNTELPVQVQQWIVDTYGETGLPWWDGDSDKLYVWELKIIDNYGRDRVIEYMKNENNYGKVLKPVINSLAHDTLNTIADGREIEGMIVPKEGVHPSEDMLENLKEFCRVFGISEYYNKADIHRPEQKEEEHEELNEKDLTEVDSINDLDEKQILQMRMNMIGVQYKRTPEKAIIYFRYSENDKPFMSQVYKIFNDHKGDADVIAIKDGEEYTTGLKTNPSVYSTLLSLYMTKKNISSRS